eukprot:m.130428 g.130428  ORF g.130428 m.130428 type:complete len:981 (-) comp14603_c0_seq5:83-3025(-)
MSYALVLDAFQAEDPSEPGLTLQTDEIVTILEPSNGSHYRGTLCGVTGSFPAANLKILNVWKEKKCLAIAKHTFESEDMSELGMREGEIMVVTGSIDENWYQGTLCGKIGIVPKDFVDLVTPPNNIPWARALAHFQAQEEDELSFFPNDIIYMESMVNHQWYRGTCYGKSGIFAVNFVSIQVELPPPVSKKPGNPFQAMDNNSTEKDRSTPPPPVPTAPKPIKTRPPLPPKPAALSSHVTKKPVHHPEPRRPVPEPPEPANRSVKKNPFLLEDKNQGMRRSPRTKPKPIRPVPGAPPLPARRMPPPSEPPRIPAKRQELSSTMEDLGRRMTVAETKLKSEYKRLYTLGQKLEVADSGEKESIEGELNQIADKITGLEDNIKDLGERKSDLLEKDEPVAHEDNKKEKSIRERILDEIIKTEDQMVNDLDGVVSVYMKDPDLERNGIAVPKLFGNLADVAKLARRFHNALLEQQDRSEEEQTIGALFLQYTEEIREVYVKYCVNYESANVLLNEKYYTHAPTKEYLDGLHARLQAEINSTAPDLNNFLIKPVQRIMKYPLLLKELGKETDASQDDRKNLDKATEEMGKVALAINEGKRTQELLARYLPSGPNKSRADNRSVRARGGVMHSVAKKGGRFQERMIEMFQKASATMDEDNIEFADLVKKLHSLVHNIKAFKKSAQKHKEASFECAKSLDECGGKLVAVFEDGDREYITQVRASLHQIGGDTNTYCKSLQTNVIEPLEKIVPVFESPFKLIEKRDDKRVDFERMKRKCKDPEKQKAFQKELDLSRSTYLAMHNQLKEDLPQLLEMGTLFLSRVMDTFLKARLVLMRASREALVKCSKIEGNVYPDKNAIFAVHKQTIREVAQYFMENFRDTPETFAKDFNLKELHSKIKLRPRPFRVAINSTVQPKSVPPAFSASSELVKCVYDFQAETEMELSVKAGQMLKVLQHSDPSGNEDWMNVQDEKGGSGCVPRAYLDSA